METVFQEFLQKLPDIFYTLIGRKRGESKLTSIEDMLALAEELLQATFVTKVDYTRVDIKRPDESTNYIHHYVFRDGSELSFRSTTKILSVAYYWTGESHRPAQIYWMYGLPVKGEPYLEADPITEGKELHQKKVDEVFKDFISRIPQIFFDVIKEDRGKLPFSSMTEMKAYLDKRSAMQAKAVCRRFQSPSDEMVHISYKFKVGMEVTYSQTPSGHEDARYLYNEGGSYIYCVDPERGEPFISQG